MRRLIICAHLDDETFGLGGSLLKWSKSNDDDIRVIVMCKGRTEKDSVPRLETFSNAMTAYYADHKVYDFNDLGLTDNLREVTLTIEEEIRTFRPDVVYSTSEGDLHRDHQIVGEATKLACRPTIDCSVKELYQYYIPCASEWNFEAQNFNVAEDITVELEAKLILCETYSTEIKPSNTSPASVDGIKSVNRFFGTKFGYGYAETMKLIYKR